MHGCQPLCNDECRDMQSACMQETLRYNSDRTTSCRGVKERPFCSERTEARGRTLCRLPKSGSTSAWVTSFLRGTCSFSSLLLIPAAVWHDHRQYSAEKAQKLAVTPPHLFLVFFFCSSRPSGFERWTRSPIFPFIRPYRDSGSPLGSVASRVLVSAVRTRLEFYMHTQQSQLVR